MVEQIRMNQKIPRKEDPELYEYLSMFSDRGRAYQARKLMLLGLVQLGKLNGQAMTGNTKQKEIHQPRQADVDNELELISQAGVDTLF